MASDPRLEAILQEVTALNADVSTKRKTRTGKYIADLKVLEKKTQATGDLDKVLQVSEERAAWEAGKSTPSFDPKDETVILSLRKLRYYFDQEITAIQEEARKNSTQRRSQIEEKFVALEKVLTTEGKIAEAIDTRTLREHFVAGTLDDAPVAAGSDKSITLGQTTAMSKPTATVETSFPLPDPSGYPPLPTRKGRIVFIKFPDVDEEFSQTALEAIQQDDYDDIVALSENGSITTIGAIRAEGRPVCWKKNGTKFDPRNVSAVKLWSGISADLMWIDDEGKAGALGGNAEIADSLKDLGKLRYISPTGNFVFAIDHSGERHLVGPNGKHPNISRAFEDKDSILATEFGGPNYVMILRNDGSLVEYYSDNPVKTHAPPKACRELLSYGSVLTANGEISFTGLNSGLKELVDESREGVSIIRNFAGYLHTMRTDSGKWLVLKRENVQWKRLENLEQALPDAIAVYPTKYGIMALLPAASVPRSGFWELDELIEALN